MMRRPPRSTRFPYTTLCRSAEAHVRLEDPGAAPRKPVGDRPAHARDETPVGEHEDALAALRAVPRGEPRLDRQSTRLNSSHANISYAVFCLTKKNKQLPNSL